MIRNWGKEAALLDGTDGTLIWSLPRVPANVVRAIDFLGDGRVVVVVAGGGVEPSLTILTADGEEQRRIVLPYPGADLPSLGFEITTGRLIVGLAKLHKSDAADHRVYAVDTETGEVVPFGVPGATVWRWWRALDRVQIQPGSAASRLLIGDSFDILLIDPETLATRQILGGVCKERKEEADEDEDEDDGETDSEDEVA